MSRLATSCSAVSVSIEDCGIKTSKARFGPRVGLRIALPTNGSPALDTA